LFAYLFSLSHSLEFIQMADTQYARFETMTNVELRAELKRRGCPTSGNKKDLLAKLRASLQIEYEQNQVIICICAECFDLKTKIRLFRHRSYPLLNN